MWSDVLKILAGGFVGFLSAVSLSNYQACRDSEKIARVLLTEVRHNYNVSRRLAEFGQKFFGAKLRSEMPAGEDPLPINPSLDVIEVLDFRRTVFEATIRDHGLLPENLLTDLHQFYWRLTETDKVLRIAEDKERSKESASKYLRVFHHHAVAVVDLVKTTNLLNVLQGRADRGLFCCLGALFLIRSGCG
jgi:hypothetical protein